MAALIDTNILVYRYDPRFPEKRRIARELLRRGVADDTIRLPHQAIVEFIPAVTRVTDTGRPLLPLDEARRIADSLLGRYTIVYPNEALVRVALRGAALYQLSWFDAHLWAYAEHFGLTPLYSEDFQHDRIYGTVRVVNPFEK